MPGSLSGLPPKWFLFTVRYFSSSSEKYSQLKLVLIHRHSPKQIQFKWTVNLLYHFDFVLKTVPAEDVERRRSISSSKKWQTQKRKEESRTEHRSRITSIKLGFVKKIVREFWYKSRGEEETSKLGSRKNSIFSAELTLHLRHPLERHSHVRQLVEARDY